jgi:hypothetical protein
VLASALSSGGADIGADRWISHHVKTIAHIKQLIALLNNEQFPDGTLVRLVGDDFSHVSRVVGRRKTRIE